MNSDRFCDGCEELDFADAVNPYDCYAARCNDPDKPVLGRHRVIAALSLGRPFQIVRPAWCRGKVRTK